MLLALRHRLEALLERLGNVLGTRAGALRIGIVIALAHAVVAWGLRVQEVTSDAASYDALATSMLQLGRYEVHGVPEAEYMPGYPVFLALVYAIAGVHAYRAVFTVQALLMGVTCIAVGDATRRLQGPRAAGLVTVLMGVMPAFYIYVTTLNAEIWVVFLISLFCWLLSVQRSLHTAHYAFFGAVGGVMMLTKPEMFLWLLVPAVGLLWHQRGVSRIAKLGVFGATALAIWLPWVLRNHATFGELIPFSTASGRGLWLSAHKPVLTEVSEPAFLAAYERCHKFVTPKTIDRCFSSEARAMLAEHPGYYLVTSAKRAVMMFVGSHTEQGFALSQSFAQARAAGAWHIVLTKLVLLGFHTSLAFAGLAGVALGALRRHQGYLAYAACVVLKILVHALVIAAPRYSLHLMPFLLPGVALLVVRDTHAPHAKE